MRKFFFINIPIRYFNQTRIEELKQIFRTLLNILTQRRKDQLFPSLVISTYRSSAGDSCSALWRK